MINSHIIGGNTIELIFDTGRIVQQFLSEYCHKQSSKFCVPSQIYEDNLSDIGLRLRPFLLRISYESDIRSFSKIIPVAAGIELIQLSTLVIDDILDKSLLRNGKESIYACWGVERGLAMGTIISAMGLALISDTLDEREYLKDGLAVMSLLSHTHCEIYEGQFLDLDYEGNVKISEPQYLDMISKTTAYFIQAPLVAGAMLWDAPSVLVAQLKRIGYNLGMAYQIRDDVTDLLGDTELTGKPKAIDVYDRKMRLPMIQALRCIDSKSRSRLLELLESKENLTTKEVEEVLDMFKQAGTIKYSINKTKEYCLKADELVDTLDSEFEIMKNHLHGVSKLISYFGKEWD